jgi:DNA-binding YbaB/EbfC family protein
MNIQKLMKQAQQMQEKLVQEQGALELEVSVGGGMVTIKMNGLKQLLDVSIDPEVLDPEDPGMIADLIQAAVNEAGRKVDEELQQRLGGMTGGLPGLF